jgi:PAS domain S-box-containing protein
MHAWFKRLSIRAQIGLFGVTILMPLIAMLVWLLAQDLRHARESAYAKVDIVAAAAAQDIQLYLEQADGVLRRLAERPLVRALEPRHCDPLLADYVQLNPEFTTYGARDLEGRIVCSYRADPIPRLDAQHFPWFMQARNADGFFVANAQLGSQSGQWVTVLVHPIRDDAGKPVGFLTLPIDLLRLSQRLLAVTPRGADVAVLDRDRTVLMRSRDAQVNVGDRPKADEPDPAAGLSAGFLSTTGRDGVPRLVAFQTVPRIGWRVVAALPQADAFADYDATVRRTAGVGLAVLLLAAGLAWNLSTIIARPIAELADTAASVASGNVNARVRIAGPAEVTAVTRQFNRMLDARDLSDARFRAIFDSATDAILTADQTQTIVMANPAAARMFGCTVATLLGSALERWMPERHRANHRREVQTFGSGAVFARHMGRTRDVLALRADGEEFPIEAAISHVEVGSQRLYTVILRDVTQRRQAEEALRESEARTRRLMSLLPHAVFVDSGDRISFANEAAQRLFGADEASLIGRSPFDLIHPDSVDVVKARVAALRSGTPYPQPGEVKIRRLDGKVRVVESVATWFEDHGSSSLLVVLHDITELKQAQIALRESHADLQRLVEAQDKLLENERRRVARELHDDLQQTLAAIRIDLGAIGERLRSDPASVPAMLAEVDDLAAAAIASTRRIVNDLRPRMLEDLGLAPALEALAAQFQQRTGIACHLDADPRASETALESTATTTCLYRVAQESLNNVAKHAQAHAVELQLESAPDGQLVLRVTDDGQGFGADDRRKPESFGLLGMHERVRALGGTVRVRSRAGAGTTVEVRLPAPEPQPVPAA